MKIIILILLATLFIGCGEPYNASTDLVFQKWLQAQDWYQTEAPQVNTSISSSDFWNSWNANLQRQADREYQLAEWRFESKQRQLDRQYYEGSNIFQSDAFAPYFYSY